MYFIPEMYLEGRISQNFDIGISFSFIVCRILNLEQKYKKIKKVTRYLSLKKRRPKRSPNNLRHAFLDKNVLHTQSKVDTCK